MTREAGRAQNDQAIPPVGGDRQVTIDLPPGTHAFSFYAEPNTFDGFTLEAIADDGASSEPVDVEGRGRPGTSGSSSTGGRRVACTEVNASEPEGFAVWEFMVSK